MKSDVWIGVMLSCVCAGVGVVDGILTRSTNIDPEQPSDKQQQQPEQQEVVEAKKSDRKGDFLAQPSYEHTHYQLPGDYGGGTFGGGGGYGGSGGHGGHYDHHHHHVDHYGGGDSLKHLLVPLAGVALLGAAALFAANPVLLQLGVISGRKKRNAVPNEYNQEVFERLNSIHLLEKFFKQFPKDQVKHQEKRLLASYLHCSGIANQENMCLERITCEIESTNVNVTNLEREVLKIVTRDIMENEFITNDLKRRILEAKQIAAEQGDCRKYFCSEFDLSKYVK